MKNIYENFKEIADDMTDGEYLAHQLSDHSSNVCYVWMTAIKEFAEALDNAEIPLPQDSKIYEKFWDNVADGLRKWKAGMNKRKPYSKKLGEISIEEAQQRYNFKGKIGHKLVIPNFTLDGELSEDYYIIK